MESKTQSPQKEAPSLLPLVKMLPSYKIVIPSEVEAKIRHLCNRVYTTEWSGVLFYTCAGSFEKADLVITCKDIYVMDIGNSTYTEFEVNPDITSYMCDNPDLLDAHIGLIHSHNNMSTFFSGTDQKTLAEEGMKRNHFVSLIVNNAGTYTAAITRRVTLYKEVEEVAIYKTFGDKECKAVGKYKEEEELIQWFNLIIDKRGNQFNDIDSRLEEIKKIKEEEDKRRKEAQSHITSYPKNDYRSRYYVDDDYTDSPRLPRLMDDEERKDSKKDLPSTKSIVLQLITGAITVGENSKIDPYKWAKTSMVSTFDKRFKKMSDFKDFMEYYCEYLLDPFSDPYNIKGDIDPLAIDEELSKLPQNKYIKVIREILALWM